MKFCRLEFSRNTDKPFAISGLEQRLTQELSDASGAGIFGQHKGRLLLWVRADKLERLERIRFKTAGRKPHTPPSWSFMAHMGAIQYIEVPGKIVNWTELDLRLTGTAETSWLYAEKPIVFYAPALDFKIGLAPENQVSITYDDPKERRDGHKCVILGTTTSNTSHYILVLRPIQRGAPANTGSGRMPYERAGAGFIPKAWVGENSIDIEIF